MKTLSSGLLLAVSLFSLVAFAEEQSVSQNRFHLLSFKCEPDDELTETTPQSPPLNVDDPSTPGCNQWEVNFVADGDFTHSVNTYETPLLDINYGIGDNLQLKYEVPYLQTRGDASMSAIGESKVGVKYEFFGDEDSKTEIAVYPQVSFISTSADAVQKGLTTPGTVVTLPVLVSKTIGKTSRGNIDFTANAGYNISSKADVANYFSGAVALGTAVFPRLSIMTELSTLQATSKIAEDPRQNLLISNVGFIGTLSRKFYLFGSVGHSLYSSDPESHTYALGGVRVMVGGI